MTFFGWLKPKPRPAPVDQTPALRAALRECAVLIARNRVVLNQYNGAEKILKLEQKIVALINARQT